ncbi:hypothetical protein OHA27_36525 [Streptomyces sp. NBC_01619]|uniref:hypothetical protein n=1 Tax=Streptomyces sp. NBC_01619 TaxID=2975901 RepID=UPI002258E9F0|nr:hypothetical protein [Streptomyces sp. NBC_01619]MCX4515694.1 hypothetical protein [Streptomyces sp. NBC_01619]
MENCHSRPAALPSTGGRAKRSSAARAPKGGAARLRSDIDLQCASPDRTVEEAAALLKDAAALHLGDFLRFAPGKFNENSEESRGGKLAFTVYLGTTKAADLKVDIVVGRSLTGIPETRTLQSAVDLEWPDE